MFGSAILDVAIGVVFLYLMLGLICTSVNELIASTLAWRANNLVAAIRRLLPGTGPGGVDLATQLCAHPLIKALSRDNRPPSYIPSRTFAMALLDIVMPVKNGRVNTIQAVRDAVEASQADDRVKSALRVLVDEAANALDKGALLKQQNVIDLQLLDTAISQVQETIEVWFNASMERASGWFKRKMQYCGAVIAILVTVLLNADTIEMVNALSRDGAVRAALVASAEKLAGAPPPRVTSPSDTPPPSGTASPSAPADARAVTDATARSLRERIDELKATGLPLGWDRKREGQLGAGGWLLKLLGLLVTAAAASLGAPVWFDVLNRFVNIRGAGKAPEEKPKTPKQIPRPMGPGVNPSP